MTPREKDCLVHEHVMKECRHRRVHEWTEWTGRGYYTYPRCVDCGANVAEYILPNYSSDMNAATSVVQRMRERGWNFRLNWDDDLPEAIFYKGYPLEDNTEIVVRCNENPATAIVDAALAAEGVTM